MKQKPQTLKSQTNLVKKEAKVANGATLKTSKREQMFLMKKWEWDRRGLQLQFSSGPSRSWTDTSFSVLKRWFKLWGQYWFTFKIK